VPVTDGADPHARLTPSQQILGASHLLPPRWRRWPGPRVKLSIDLTDCYSPFSIARSITGSHLTIPFNGPGCRNEPSPPGDP
jgi:hypothetical protein